MTLNVFLGDYSMSQDLMVAQLRFLTSNVGRYLQMYPSEHGTWSPHHELRSLFSLACHLAAIPSVSVAMLRSESLERIFALHEPFGEAGSQDLIDLLTTGSDEFQSLLVTMSIKQYSQTRLPNPFGAEFTPETLALDTVTHLVHHRGQLHNYYKQLGLCVTTNTLYDI